MAQSNLLLLLFRDQNRERSLTQFSEIKNYASIYSLLLYIIHLSIPHYYTLYEDIETVHTESNHKENGMWNSYVRRRQTECVYGKRYIVYLDGYHLCGCVWCVYLNMHRLFGKDELSPAFHWSAGKKGMSNAAMNSFVICLIFCFV